VDLTIKEEREENKNIKNRNKPLPWFERMYLCTSNTHSNHRSASFLIT